MDCRREIVGFSFAFVLGSAAGTLLSAHASLLARTLILSTLCLLSCTLALTLLLCGRTFRWQIPLLMLLLGSLCSLGGGLREAVLPEVWGPDFTEEWAEKLKSLTESLPMRHPESSALMKALICGDRSSLSGSTLDAFRAAGASHILALSGMHLGIIYMLLLRPLALAGGSGPARVLRYVTVTLAAGLFTAVTRAGASLDRAFLFILIAESGKLMPERRSSLPHTYAAALTIQLTLKPSVLTDVGFQLSYLAMAGIVFLLPRMREWYPQSGLRPSLTARLWNTLALSLSCQLFTAPAAWYYFHSFPAYFLLTNLLAMPLTTAAMSTAVVCLGLSAAGICPEVLVQLLDHLFQALLFTVSTIGSL